MAGRQPEKFKAFPGFEPKRKDGSQDGEIVGAQFFIGDQGHVIRGRDLGKTIEQDGAYVNVFERGSTINARLGGGRQTLSVIKAVVVAFATHTPADDDAGVWVPIIAPDTPEDPETGVTRCAATDIYWTRYAQACHWYRKSEPPTTLIAIVS